MTQSTPAGARSKRVRNSPTAWELSDISPGTVKRLLLSLLDSGRGAGAIDDSLPQPSAAEEPRLPSRIQGSHRKERGGLSEGGGQQTAEEDSVGTALSSCGECGACCAVAQLAILLAEEASLREAGSGAHRTQSCIRGVQFAHAAGVTMHHDSGYCDGGHRNLQNTKKSTEVE